MHKSRILLLHYLVMDVSGRNNRIDNTDQTTQKHVEYLKVKTLKNLLVNHEAKDDFATAAPKL